MDDAADDLETETIEVDDDDGLDDTDDGFEDLAEPEGDTDDETDEFEDLDATTGGDIDSEESETDAGTAVEGRDSAPVAGGKPYLETLPSGYVADIVVMDWLEFLVEETGIDGAARTIAYYEAIDWIDEPAAETLQTFLNGFGGEVEADPEPRSSLPVAHHNTSLRYISRIVNPDMEMVSFGGSGSDRPRASREVGRAAGGQRARQGVEPDGGRELPNSSGMRDRLRNDGTKRNNGQSSEFNWGGSRTE
jgi:flagellar protein FlaC